MEEEPVDLLERHLGEVFVSAVHRVAGLESHHGRPSALGECGAGLRRSGGKLLGRGGRDADRAGDRRAALREQRGDAGVRGVVGPVHLASLRIEIALEDLLDGDGAENTIALVAKRDDRALTRELAGVAGGKGDREGPRGAVAQLGAADDALVVGAAEEPLHRRIGAAAEQREIGRRGGWDAERRELVRTRDDIRKLVRGHHQIDQRPPERCDEACLVSHSGRA